MSTRILLVDDDASTRHVLARVLAQEGYSVGECSSAGKALEQLLASPFDVLLTDLVMPEGGGLELIAEASKLYPALRCLIMSGHPRTRDVATTIAWVDKPIDIDKLLATLGP